MDLTDIQNYAIQARVAAVLGASEFDRVFAGIRFAEVGNRRGCGAAEGSSVSEPEPVDDLKRYS
jgi:hypothetical protein